MTQTLMDSLSGVEITLPEIRNAITLSDVFSTGETFDLWLTETEISDDILRWRGVDLKNDWIPVFLDICEEEARGYICIPAKSVKDVTEEKLRALYCDIAKRLGAVDVLFNGVSLLEASS